ncbi:hypothetical protein [Actinomycetospora flava]|uniref:Allene oxide cyclase barrel-like domain-containing protein n=1 Tax=Actinomycetospora flava TaxID=3129232 RepID=A0ABU8M6R4_9PSEU
MSGAYAYDDQEKGINGTTTLTAKNDTDDWASVIVQVITGEDAGMIIFNTERIHKRSAVTESRDTTGHFTGEEMRVFRWAPGFAGVAGSGGGEARFVMPDTGDVTLQITVVPPR